MLSSTKYVPEEVGFVNALVNKENLQKSLVILLKLTNVPTTAKFLDDIKDTWIPYGLPWWIVV